MILTVYLDSEVPIYQQLRDQIVEAIAQGVLVDGSSLPSTRALTAAMLAVGVVALIGLVLTLRFEGRPIGQRPTRVGRHSGTKQCPGPWGVAGALRRSV